MLVAFDSVHNMGQNFQPGKWTGRIFFQAVHFKSNLSQNMREFSNFSWSFAGEQNGRKRVQDQNYKMKINLLKINFVFDIYQ